MSACADISPTAPVKTAADDIHPKPVDRAARIRTERSADSDTACKVQPSSSRDTGKRSPRHRLHSATDAESPHPPRPTTLGGGKTRSRG